MLAARVEQKNGTYVHNIQTDIQSSPHPTGVAMFGIIPDRRSHLQGLNPADVERVFREHAADLNSSASASSARILAFDGKALKGSFDAFNDAKARQILSAFAVDTALVLAHIVIDEKSNEIPAVQKLLEELDVAGHIVTLDAMHCQKKHSKPPPKRRRI
jgi:hypothetical protein